jgi:hypothetical protein
MIYSVDEYPKKDDTKEITVLRDLDNEEWEIIRTKHDMYLTYLGEKYDFTHFNIKCNSGDKKVKNSNLYKLQNGSFEFYCWLREMIKEQQTEDVISNLELMFTYRFNKQVGMLSSEID